MQQRIKWVLWLIIVFIVTINVLQGIWIYNNFKEQDKQYKSLLTSCLSEAVFSYQLHQIRQNKKASETFYIISGDQEIKLQPTDSSMRQLILTSPARILLDSISGGLGHSQLIQIQNRDSLNIPLFESLFNSALKKNGIDASYILRVQKNELAKKNPPIREMDSLIPTKIQYAPDDGEYTVKTAGMLVNTYGNQVVYAAFKPYPGFIFKKMFGMLLLSLCLFTIVNVALIYVFKTFRKQKKINEIKNDFINNMTHELRTPVTIASSAIDVLLNHHGLNDKQKTRRYLQTSKEELLHLDNLVEKILNLAVEDKEDNKLNYEILNLKHILSTLVKNHTLIHSKEVNFHLDLAGLDKDIYLDRMHFSNALNNIIDNAIKYTEGPAEIYISGFISSIELRLLIKDNGPGIPKEQHTAVFEPFYRIPTGDRHNVKGFGLGLSYVNKIIKIHGGSIEIESQTGKGSTFIISIPISNKNNG